MGDDAKSDSNSQQATKRKRPQSCDICRSRKIKCVRLKVDGLDASADNRCVQCRAIDAKCTFDYVLRRPGPQSTFAKTARKEAAARTKVSAPDSHLAATPLSHSRSLTSAFVEALATQVGGASPQTQHNASAASPNDDSWYRALTASNYASGSANGTQTRSSSWSGATNFDAYLNNSMLAMTPAHLAGITAASPFGFSPQNMGSLAGASPSVSMSGSSSATPGSYAGSSWHGQPRSDAGSSRSAAPLASMLHTQPQPHQQTQAQEHPHQQQQQQQHRAAALVDHIQSFEVAAGLAGTDTRAAPLPLPIPSFSRVSSPVPMSATLPQTHQHNTQEPTQQNHQPQQIPIPSHQQQQGHCFDGSGSFAPLNTQAHADTCSATSQKNKQARSLCDMSVGPVLEPRSLDNIAPRQTFLAIISLYFHYLWPLLPIVDRPSFSHDLLNRRDERDQAFFAFVLSLTSYTLIQCPRTVIPAPWAFYRRLHRICHLTSRRMQPRVYDPPQLLHVSTLYCDHIYLGTVGKVNAGKAVLAEAVRVAYTLGLHDERKDDSRRGAAPYGLDASSFAYYQAPTANAVENELRKRLFWVLHGSSTTIAMLENEPALIHAIDACVDLPLAVDEEALARPGHIQRSPSVLHGFLIVTRLHQVMLELLESYRRDRRFPIDDFSVARSRIRYLADVLRRLQEAIDDMPEELRNPIYTHSPPEPIRRPGSALPALVTVSAHGQHAQHEQHAPLLQAIGFDAATQTALGNHVSGTSPWPWPAETFTRDGLPNAEARSSNNSSSTHSPRAGGACEANMSTRYGGAMAAGAGVERGQPAHHGLAPLAVRTPRMRTGVEARAASLTMMDMVNVFRPSPPPASASSTPVLSPMCTLHANIVTTESLVRFLLTEYRDMVTTRIRELKLRQPSHLALASCAPEDVHSQVWQEAAANLLRTFNNLPLDALASNGQSLIDKIIYVVTALLNRTSSRGVTTGFGYMSSLLATLTRLSQTRKEDSASEIEEEDAVTGERWVSQQMGGEGGAGGAGTGGTGGAGGTGAGGAGGAGDQGGSSDRGGSGSSGNSGGNSGSAGPGGAPDTDANRGARDVRGDSTLTAFAKPSDAPSVEASSPVHFAPCTRSTTGTSSVDTASTTPTERTPRRAFPKLVATNSEASSHKHSALAAPLDHASCTPPSQPCLARHRPPHARHPSIAQHA